MSIDVFSFHCDPLEDAKLVGFKGVEGLSRPYEFDVFFTVPVGTDVKGAIGGRATLTADRDAGQGPMCFQGVLAKVRLMHETAERALYRGALVPKVWLLRHHVRSYVYTKKRVHAFVADTLQAGGISTSDFQFALSAGPYPQEEFVCQYRESHLDFLQRWLEREGLYYYFEHPEGAGASEKLMVVDDKAHHHPLLGEGKVRYYPSEGQDGSAGESFRELSADFDLLPASVTISDYNYANPSAPLQGEKAVSGAGQGLIHEYGYRVFSDGDAKRLAQVKAQSIGCRELVLSAAGNVLGIRAGYTFEVEDVPADLPAEYLAVEVRHAGAVSGASAMVRRYTGLDAKETYRVEVVAIPANVQFRASQTTAWPRIYGFENGTVDGPGESQYAQIDEQGRYLVRFKFDVSDLPDGSTSTYLRMMQPHGGSTEGWHFPLRKGTEVMVSFQGGDPDRPVIAGVVPNAVQPSNVTAKNHTQNVLRTGGGNFLMMDDIDGLQTVTVSTPVDRTKYTMGGPVSIALSLPPHDPLYADEPRNLQYSLALETDGSAAFIVGGNWLQTVARDYWLDVSGAARTRYRAQRTLIVGGPSNEYYLGARKTVAAAGRTDLIEAGGLTQVIAPGGSQTVKGNWTQDVSAKNYGHYGKWDVDVDTTWTVTATGSIALASAGGNVSVSALGGELSLVSPNKINMVSPEIEQVTGDWLQTAGKSFLLYTSANTAGAHKFDATIVANSVTGVSTSQVGLSVGVTGVKVESNGFKKVNEGVDLSENAVKIANGAIRLLSFGLLKLG